MTVVLHMKIGTISVGAMRVKYARKRPAIGAKVWVKSVGHEYRWHRWERVVIDRYSDDGYCFASRM